MDEVDKIIIDSLKRLDCPIEEGIISLKQFDTDSVTAAVSTCLECINPHLDVPKKLPPSLSARIKICSNLANQIRDLGFKSEIGYQTILYCNEVEVRRVLMFLIERLPKETSQVTHIEQTGYVPKIVKQIESRLRGALKKHWLPAEALNYGVRDTTDGYIVNSFGQSCPLKTVDLNIPSSSEVLEDCSKYIGNVTKQCSNRQLIPSLLFMDTDLQHVSKTKQRLSEESPSFSKDVYKVEPDVILSDMNVVIPKSNVEVTEQYNKTADSNKIEELAREIRKEQELYVALQTSFKECQKYLQKVKDAKADEEVLLKNSITKIKLKKKSLAALSSNDNIPKLKKLIENSKERLMELNNQWDEIKTALIEERNTLSSSVDSESLRSQNDQIKLENLRQNYSEMVKDLKEKTILEQNLTEKCKILNMKNNRAAYTRRILEIVGNIKKQNDEIQKVLKDTRQIQKEINNLTGQVDRSFTLADELIYYAARQDDTAKTAYKLLVSLRDECLLILTAVSDLGQAERESRNLEEQVELEKSKEIKAKLEKINQDLTEITKEIDTLS